MSTLEIHYRNSLVSISYYVRRGSGQTVLYLHGLGTSKEDFAPSHMRKEFEDYNLVSFDFPGCGQSTYPFSDALEIDDLLAITSLVVEQLNLDRFHLIGHSMGGLIALLYSRAFTDRVLSFVNVEGNLHPIDCRVFSRYVNDYDPSSNEEIFFLDFKKHMCQHGHIEFEIFLENLQDKVIYRALRGYCRSIVSCCSSTPLMSYFTDLQCPTAFIYGEENRDLPYLNRLRKREIPCCEIEGSNHFPFYSNPDQFFSRISAFYENQVDLSHN